MLLPVTTLLSGAVALIGSLLGRALALAAGL